MICPKCNGEQKGELHVLKKLARKTKKTTPVPITCNECMHFFSIPSDVLQGARDLRAEDITNNVSVKKMEKKFPKELMELDAYFYNGHKACVSKFPTIENYRKRLLAQPA